jgi:hypothetical protein
MNSSINLIGGKRFDLEEQLRKIKIAKIIAIFSLSSVALISLILFLITFFLPISSVKKDQQQTLTNLSLLHKKLISYFLVKDRIDNISQIIDKRKNYGTVSAAVLQKVPLELNIETLSIEDKTLTLVLESNKKKLIENLLIESLTLSSQTGKYSLTLQADVL